MQDDTRSYPPSDEQARGESPDHGPPPTADPLEPSPSDHGSPDPSTAPPSAPYVLPNEATVISQRPPLHTSGSEVGIASRELGQTLEGRRLAHFELVEFVGGGGMGAVFRAIDTMLSRTVAVKVLSRDQGEDEETVRRFRNEAQSAARLDHDHIARVYYVGEDDGWYFIVFEFIEGQNLRDLVAEHGVFSVELSLNITLQIAAALDHAWRREVVHRDIKPSNVLLTPSGRAKLVDMGLARFQTMRASGNDLTASGVTLGTFDYISPEQARDPRTADVRSDIYSLGCTLFFMLTGRPPFPDGTVLQKLLSHSGEAPPDPRQFRPDLPEEIAALISRMLAKQPKDRYQDPGELIGDLLVLAEQLGIKTTLRADPIWVTARRPRSGGWAHHLPWIVPVVLLLVIGFVIEPLWFGRSSQANTQQFVVPTVPASDDASDPNPQATSDVPIPTEPRTSGIDDVPNFEAQTAAESTPREFPPAADLNRATAPFSNSESNDNSSVAGTTPSDDEDEVSGEAPILRATNGHRILVVEPSFDRTVTRHPTARTLSDACRMASEDPLIDTIEIRRNGRLALESIDLALPGRHLTWQAGDGYQPTLVFRTAFSVLDPQSQFQIRLVQGELSLVGLHLEMSIPSETLEGEWSLFQLEQARRIALRDCTITVVNSHGGRFSNLDHISVFHLIHPAQQLNAGLAEANPRLTAIDLRNCVIRGETSVVRMRESIPLRFQWENGLLATTERLLVIGGSPTASDQDAQIMVDLDHLTAVMDKGLAELYSETSAPYLINVSIWCTNCILVTQPWASLVSQRGPHSLANLTAQLEYFGENNFYDGPETFWKLSPMDASQTDLIDFARWQQHWSGEQQPHLQAIRWQNAPRSTRPMHDHRVADYALAYSENPSSGPDPALQGAGSRTGTLPRLPEPTESSVRKTRPIFPY